MMIRSIATAAAMLVVSIVGANAQDVSGDPTRGQALMTEMQCPRCHGTDGKGRSDTPGVPRIDGQYETYLINQLFNFRDGRRPHRFMEAYASRLDGQTVRDLAAFYACQGDATAADMDRCAPVR
ncbi:MAG: cytochrome c [Alphaproteobacteria bacterium]